MSVWHCCVTAPRLLASFFFSAKDSEAKQARDLENLKKKVKSLESTVESLEEEKKALLAREVAASQ